MPPHGKSLDQMTVAQPQAALPPSLPGFALQY
jgi:hypothetical protein